MAEPTVFPPLWNWNIHPTSGAKSCSSCYRKQIKLLTQEISTLKWMGINNRIKLLYFGVFHDYSNCWGWVKLFPGKKLQISNRCSKQGVWLLLWGTEAEVFAGCLVFSLVRNLSTHCISRGPSVFLWMDKRQIKLFLCRQQEDWGAGWKIRARFKRQADAVRKKRALQYEFPIQVPGLGS